MTIQTSALDSGLNEVVIEAKGYKNQSITVTVESQKADTEIEVSSVVKESGWTGDYLLIRFNGVEGEKLKTFLKEIDSVAVNGTEYSKASVSSFLGSGEFAPHATDTSYSNDNYDCLKVSVSGLSKEENNEILIDTKNNGTIECKLDKNWKLIKESKTLLADEVLPSEIVTTPTEGVTTPEQTPAEDATPEEPKTNDENKADVPDGDKKNETDDANKAPEVDEDKKEDSDESKDTSDEKKDETSDKGDADKDDSKDESGETGDDSKKNETDESKDNDSKKDETGDVKDDTSDKEESDGGKGDASEKEESVSEEE